MPLQNFVPGDRVAYLVKKAAGFEACCGSVIELFYYECERLPVLDTFEAVITYRYPNAVDVETRELRRHGARSPVIYL